MIALRFLETAFITANWIVWCPLIGRHWYFYIVFKALNLNGKDIMRVTFKLLNPEDVIRVLERGGRYREGGGRERGKAEERHQREGLGDYVLRETVQQNDSAGLLFDRLPACQFQCNIFIDTLLTTSWQTGRSSTFAFHTRSLGFVKQVPWQTLEESLFSPRCLLLKEVCKTGNVYSLDLENALSITVHIFCI